jgi:hypothetical protein
MKIGYNTAAFERLAQIEKELFAAKDELIELSEQTCGINKITDLKKFLEQPGQYLVDLYRTLYLSNRPEHLDFKTILENETRVSISRINEVKVRYDKATLEMRNHAPTLNADTMTSNLDPKAFDIILDPVKKDHYNALKSFLYAIENLKNYTNVNSPRNFVRSIPDITLQGLQPTIQINKFTK